MNLKNTSILPIKPTNYMVLYGALLLGLYFIYQFLTPIRIGDTDMWYHLNAGRYFWEHIKIPNTTFFSFIQPEREWTNYYWGFQATIFKVFDIAHYQGLIILRSLLTSSTLILLFLYLQKSHHKNTDNQSSIIRIFLLISLIIIIYDPRAYQLRPHLFSYFFISLFIFILEFKPNKAIFLPILTILWANTHGIEWPAGALICGAYVLPHLIKRVKSKQKFQPQEKVYVASILLCAPALIINPYGWHIFLAPFNVPADVYLYTSELKKVSLETITTLHINGLIIPHPTAITLLFMVSFLLLIRGLLKRDIPLPHLILYCGGLILLYQGKRFVWEWLLLSTPLLSQLFHIKYQKIRRFSQNKIFQHAIILAVLSLPTYTLYQNTKNFGHYPFDSRNLPTGISAFLKKIQSNGHIMAPPSQAGYTEWSLSPQYKTFIDMQYPPFTAKDFFDIRFAYADLFGLKKFIQSYQPDWILLPIGHKPSSTNIKKIKMFVPVFFDDVQVLYANKKTRKTIAQQYELKDINPHSLLDKSVSPIKKRIQAIQKIMAIAPNQINTTHALAAFYFEDKQYDLALRFSKRLKEVAPLNPNGYYLEGISLQNLNHFKQANHAFKQALPFSAEDFKPTLYRSLATTYYLQKNFIPAYDYFKKSMNPYTQLHKAEDLYMYAFSAVMTGHLNHGQKLLEMILYSIDAKKHEEVYQNSTGLYQQVINGELITPSVFDWLKSLFTP